MNPEPEKTYWHWLRSKWSSFLFWILALCAWLVCINHQMHFPHPEYMQPTSSQQAAMRGTLLSRYVPLKPKVIVNGRNVTISEAWLERATAYRSIEDWFALKQLPYYFFCVVVSFTHGENPRLVSGNVLVTFQDIKVKSSVGVNVLNESHILYYLKLTPQQANLKQYQCQIAPGWRKQDDHSVSFQRLD